MGIYEKILFYAFRKLDCKWLFELLTFVAEMLLSALYEVDMYVIDFVSVDWGWYKIISFIINKNNPENM